MIDLDKLYTSNMGNEGRKSFQWNLWSYCNNNCKFCFLGEANRQHTKERQLTSLRDLSSAIDNLDFNEYNNISLIGGEFFQGQLVDEEIRNEFFSCIRKIFQLYVDKKIGSIWLTCTLTLGDQKDLYKVLDLANQMGVHPVEDYNSSGLWLCTSWDAKGRFHNDKMKLNWDYHMKNIKSRYPWIKLNTTIILQKAFIDMYLNNEFKPKQFMKEYHTSLFYMQPCLAGVVDMMIEHNKHKTVINDKEFSELWLKLKQETNQKFEFFPERSKFMKFLSKYYIEDRDTFIKLFNIKFRSDEIHINSNSLDHDIVLERSKNSNIEESFPPPMKCKHVYNYACYIDSNQCCLCDKELIIGI